jgi:hypothetical protein
LECAEIRGIFVTGRIPSGPEADAHLAVCPHCRELLAGGGALGRQLAEAILPEAPGTDLLSLVERDVAAERGLRAHLRAWPLSARVSVLTAVALLLLASQLLMRRRADFAEYSPVAFWGLCLVLCSSLLLGAGRLLLGPSASLSTARRQRTLALLLLIVPALAALLSPMGSSVPEAAMSWGSPMSCFKYGAALVVPFVVLYWLFERRDRVPLWSLVSAGALAGIAANLLLHAHCPSAHLGHLLLGHASIGVVWAMLLMLLAKPLQRAS